MVSVTLSRLSSPFLWRALERAFFSPFLGFLASSPSLGGEEAADSMVVCSTHNLHMGSGQGQRFGPLQKGVWNCLERPAGQQSHAGSTGMRRPHSLTLGRSGAGGGKHPMVQAVSAACRGYNGMSRLTDCAPTTFRATAETLMHAQST